MVWLWLAFSMCFFALGESFSKLWVLNHHWWQLVLVYVGYMASVTGWLMALSCRTELTVVSVIWSLATIVVTMVVGLGFFKEQISVWQMIGLGLAVVAMYLTNG